MYYIILCFVSLLSGAFSALIFEGPCPEVKGVKDINITAYSKAPWYEMARYPDDWEGICIVLTFDQNKNELKYATNSVVNSKFQRIEGRIDFDKNTNLSNGVILFKSKVFESSEGEVFLPLTLLAIDYDKYYIGYDCKYFPSQNLRHIYLWVLSRTKELDPKSKLEIANVIKSYSFLDMNKLNWFNFTEETCELSYMGLQNSTF